MSGKKRCPTLGPRLKVTHTLLLGHRHVENVIRNAGNANDGPSGSSRRDQQWPWLAYQSLLIGLTHGADYPRRVRSLGPQDIPRYASR